MTNRFGTELRAKRLMKGHTLDEAVMRMGTPFSASTLSKIERGVYRYEIKKAWIKAMGDYKGTVVHTKKAEKTLPRTTAKVTPTKKSNPFIQRIMIEYHHKNGYSFKTVGYMVANYTNSGNFVSIGVSICHHKDQFDKKLGRKLAAERVNDYRMPLRIPEPYNNNYYSIESQYDYFVKRTVQRFKGANVILPSVTFV